MTDVTPLVQPPVEDLRNALQIAEAQIEVADIGMGPMSELVPTFESIARLLRHALAQLGEPNTAAIDAAKVVLRERNALAGFADDEVRYARDCAAAILDAQLRGAPPPQPNTQPSEDT